MHKTAGKKLCSLTKIVKSQTKILKFSEITGVILNILYQIGEKVSTRIF